MNDINIRLAYRIDDLYFSPVDQMVDNQIDLQAQQASFKMLSWNLSSKITNLFDGYIKPSRIACQSKTTIVILDKATRIIVAIQRQSFQDLVLSLQKYETQVRPWDKNEIGNQRILSPFSSFK